MPTCWIIAGPNGAGKTTFALEYLPKVALCRQRFRFDLCHEPDRRRDHGQGQELQGADRRRGGQSQRGDGSDRPLCRRGGPETSRPPAGFGRDPPQPAEEMYAV